MKSQVVLLQCTSYEEETVYRKIRKGLELLGGLQTYVSAEEKILLKPNLLRSATPEKAVTTHPSVFGGILRCLREDGYNRVAYGDSSAGTGPSPEKTAETAGLAQQAEKYGISMANFHAAVSVKNPDGKVCKKFELNKGVKAADAIISICKMKTHALENITGAVKNQYGCIAGLNKPLGHALYPNSKAFAEMIVDLDLYLKPRLYIMDGIIAMEGNGPSAGDPVPMNVILMSADPVALDRVFAGLVHLDPQYVPTCVCGQKRGLGTMIDEEISILTENGEIDIEEAVCKFGNPDFKVMREKRSFWKIGMLLPSKHRYADRPEVDEELCIGCGACQEVCPAEGKAVHAGKGVKAVYDYKKCIRCYCCQEICPQKAISRAEKKGR